MGLRVWPFAGRQHQDEDVDDESWRDNEAKREGNAEGTKAKVQHTATELKTTAGQAAKTTQFGAKALEKQIDKGIQKTVDGKVDKKTKKDTERLWYEAEKSATRTGQRLRIPVPPLRLGLLNIGSLRVKQLACGVLAGGVSSGLLITFDTVRTRTLANRTSALDVVSTAAQKHEASKLVSIYFKTPLKIAAASRGIQFVVYEMVNTWQKRQRSVKNDFFNLPHLPGTTLAGLAAGLASTIATYPVQAVMDRVVLQPEIYTGIGKAMKKVLVEEGVAGLYHGVAAACLQIVPSTCIGFLAYEHFKESTQRISNREELATWQQLLVGAASGAVSTIATYPIEIARKHTTMSMALPQFGPAPWAGNPSIADAFHEILKEEGVRGLYRGIGPKVLQRLPATAISFLIYEVAKRTLVAYGEESRSEVKG